MEMTDSRRLPDWVLLKRSRRNFHHKQLSSCDETSGKLTSSSTTFTLVAATVVTAYAGYKLNRSLQEYGWEGTLRLIWEGDPYDPNLRDAVNKLEDTEFDLRATYRIDDRLNGLEEALDTATANASSSVSNAAAVNMIWNQAWMNHPANRTRGTMSRNCSNDAITVEHTLADISDRLDKIAARVDGVILSFATTSSLDKIEASKKFTKINFLTQRVKERKKKLSRAIVSDMERCDALVTSYQVLQKQAR